MEINEIINNYRNFLNLSWPSLNVIMEKLDWGEFPYFVDDWMQANWQLLVEKQIHPAVVLRSYGYDGSPLCRYADQEKTPTHRLVCWERNSREKSKHIFLCFTAGEKGLYPPFDYVHVKNPHTGELSEILLTEVHFDIDAMDNKEPASRTKKRIPNRTSG